MQPVLPDEAAQAKHSIFISYGRADTQALAIRLEMDLRTLGHTVWLDCNQIRSGASWEQQIEVGVLGCDVFLALLSPHAVRRPDGVCLDEISMARYNGRRIIPAMIIRCRPPLGIYRLDWIDFQDWEAPGRYETGFARLITALTHPGGVEGGYARIFGSLRPLDFGPEVVRASRDFTGREWLAAELDDWLRGDSRLFLITGDPGTGKSAFLAHLVQWHPAVVAYHFCTGSLADSLDPLRFARSVAAQLATQRDGYRVALENADLEAADLDPNVVFRRLVVDPLRGEPRGTPNLLLVDALDESLLPSGLSIARLLRDRLDDLPGWVRLVVSSRNDPGVLDLFSRFPPHEIAAERDSNRRDIAALIRLKIAEPGLAAVLARHGVNPEPFAESIAGKAAGNFLYATQALAAVTSGQLDPRLPADFPDGLVGIYHASFDRLFPGGNGFDTFRPLLDVLIAAREPITPEQVAAIVGRDPFDVSIDLERVAAFFPERDGAVRPFHQSVTDWLRGRAGRSRQFRVNEPNGHRLMAARLLGDWRSGDAGRFILAHLPAHLAAAGRDDELSGILTDIDFVEAKARAGLTSELAVDYARTGDSPPVALAAWRHFVANHATPLSTGECPAFQLAYNSAAGGPVADAMAYRLHAGGGPHGPWIRALIRPAPTAAPACLRTLEGHTGAVVAIAVTPSGHRAISGGTDGTVRFWDLETGNCRHVLTGPSHDVASVDLTPDARFGLSGGGDHIVRVWNLETGQCRHCLAGHESRVRTLAVVPGGTRAVSGGDDATVRVWDLVTGVGTHILHGHTLLVTAIAVTADGRLAVSGGMDRVIRVWDLESGRCVYALQGHPHPILAIVIAPDGGTVRTADRENGTRVWDLCSGRCLAVHTGSSGRLRSVALTPEDISVFAEVQGATLLVCETQNLRRKELIGHAGPVYAIAVTPDGRRAVSASADASVRVWDVANASVPSVRRAASGQGLSVIVSGTGRRVVSSGIGGTLQLWDADGHLLNACVGHENDVLDTAFTPDGSKVLSAGADWSIRVWRVHTGECVRVLTAPATGWHSDTGEFLPTSHVNCVSGVKITPDGRRAVSSSWDCTVRIWDVESGDCTHVLRGHEDVVHSVIVSPDGRLAVSTAYDRVPHVWDVAAGKVVAILSGHTEEVRGLAFTPDGASVVTASRDRTVRVWDAVTGHHLLTLKGHTDRVDTVAVVPDNHLIVTAGWDATLRVWNLGSGAELSTCSGHRGPIDDVVVTADSGRVVTAGRDGTIRVWKLSTGQRLAVYTSPGGAVSRLAVHGNRIYSATTTGWVDVLALEGMPDLGPPRVTAVRLWKFDIGWDERLTVYCPGCGTRSSVARSDLGQDRRCPVAACGLLVRICSLPYDNSERLPPVRP